MTERRTLEDGQAWLLERLARRVHPLDSIDPDGAEQTIRSLTGLGPQEWTFAWGALGDRFAAEAAAAAAVADRQRAWMEAYRAAFLGRYPTPNHALVS